MHKLAEPFTYPTELIYVGSGMNTYMIYPNLYMCVYIYTYFYVYTQM